MIEDNIRLVKKAGGSIINHKPVFSANNRTLYVGCGPILRSFSTETGEHLHDYEVNVSVPYKPEGSIVDIAHHPFDRNTVLCCFEECHVIGWSFETNHVVRDLVLDAKKTNAVGMKLSVTSVQNELFDVIVAIKRKKYGNKIKLKIFSFEDGSLKHIIHNLFDDSKHSWSVAGPNGKKFLAAIRHNRLTVVNLTTNKCNRDIMIGNERYFTCVACHPTEECVAAGDNTGRVILYYSFLEENSRSPFYVFHWHTLPVNNVTFSDTGNYFYSGGGEHVLVKWMCNAPEVRHFLPRLAAPIVHITGAAQNELVAVSTLDNGILIIDAQNHIVCTIQQFTWGFTSTPGQELFPCGLVVDYRSNCIVMNGRPGHIQFYSPHHSTLVYNMDIAAQNYVSQERSKIIVNFEIIAVQFSSDGTWLATAQIRDDPEFHSDTYLKFWLFDRKSQTYKLKTSVTSYHRISKILFQPIEENTADSSGQIEYVAVTRCADNKFRVWMEKSLLNIPKKSYRAWNCDSIGYYRDHPLHDICFSSDGSLLGCAFGPCFTIWDVDTNVMKCSLSKGTDQLSKIAFGYDDCSHIAVSVNKSTVFVWNLLSCTVLWTFDVEASILVADPHSGHIAIFSPTDDLFIFKLTSDKPVYTRNAVCENGAKVLSAVFFPGRNVSDVNSADTDISNCLRNSSLYFFTSKQELMAFESRVNDMKESIVTIQEQLPVTPFQALVASQKTSAVVQASVKQHAQLGTPWNQKMSQFLSFPAHSMPSIHLLCKPLLQSFLIQKQKS